MTKSEADARVSVVMITRDRCDEALAAVQRILALPEKPPVVVVDNASADDTAERIRALGRGITVTRLDRNAGAAARNVGVELTSTPYVAFCDDDSGWAPGALQQAAELFDAHPSLALIAARVLVGPNHVVDAACLRMATSPLPAEPALPGRPVLGFIACGAVVRREAFLDAGGFDERYGVGGEEEPLAIELAARSWCLSYVDDITALHFTSAIRDRAHRRRVVARNQLWVAWQRRSWRSAIRKTAAVIRASVRDAAIRRGLADAILGAPTVLRSRQCIPAALERRLQLVD